ncbi:MAG: hypothetical protein HY909_25145 [Deltaproteobacteria bacterium]|nr:hypothetical protein [Deltaproteobacteria bacterium]
MKSCRQRRYLYGDLERVVGILLVLTVACGASTQFQEGLDRRGAPLASAVPFSGEGDSGTSRRPPEPIIHDLAAGHGHTCMVAGSGRIPWCWGQNESGQLGDSTILGRTHPTPVSGLGDVIQISLGMGSSCALDRRRRVWCWGELAWPGAIPAAPRPTMLGTRGSVASISVGLSHSCLREESGEVWCWGLNSSGELGLGRCIEQHRAEFPSDQESTLEGLRVPELPPMVQVSSASMYNAGFTSDGTIWTWGGGNCMDPLFPGLLPRRPRHAVGAEQRAHVPGITMISAGADALCIRTLLGIVQCLGANQFGTLGDGTTTDRSNFGPVQGLDEVTALGGRMESFCAVRRDGSLWCWGNNEYGQLGAGRGDETCLGPSFRHALSIRPVPCRRRPTRVPLPAPVVRMALGGSHACAALSDDSLWCWGRNEYGEVGDGTLVERWLPVRIFWEHR